MDLFTPDFGLIFWMFVSFAVLFLILWKFAWPAIIKTVDSRADLIDNASMEAKKYIAEAQRQQAEMLREADKMKTRIIEDARAAAQKEAQKVMDAAKVSIEQSRKEAEQSFRDQVSGYALDIAQKVVRNQLADSKAQSALVGQLLDEIESKN